MLKFEVYKSGKPSRGVKLAGAYMFGQDLVPVHADLLAEGHVITCRTSSPETCGLAVLFDAGAAGAYILSTTRLPERPNPYLLNLELARARMRELYAKRADWALFDFDEASDLNGEFDELRAKFAHALGAAAVDFAEASVLADDVLDRAIILGEKYALFHAEILAKQRIELSSSGLPMGCRINIAASNNGMYVAAMKTFTGFLSLPLAWNEIVPSEGDYNFKTVDAWMNFCARENKTLHAGPVLDFSDEALPEWLALYHHDYAALKHVILEHLKKVVQRYRSYVRVWTVVSGINSRNALGFSFEQISELTRSCCQCVRQIVPDAQVIVELTCPWSEFYARNFRTIPTMLYADMISRSDMPFDAFGLRLLMGVDADGYFVRDLMQISSLLDEFTWQGKKLHVTACGVPSAVDADPDNAWGQDANAKKAGHWHGPWTRRLQAEWLHALCRLALSKSFVKSICWQDMADIPGKVLPHGGLRMDDFKPKLSLQELYSLQEMWKDIAALGDF